MTRKISATTWRALDSESRASIHASDRSYDRTEELSRFVENAHDVRPLLLQWAREDYLAGSEREADLLIAIEGQKATIKRLRELLITKGTRV